MTDAPHSAYQTVYICSKLMHAEKLRDLRSLWPRIHFTARWPVVATLSAESNKPAALWLQDNFDDIERSGYLVIWANTEDELKGAIFETGYAYRAGKTIYVVGDCHSFGKWRFAHGITRRHTLEEVLREISDKLKYQQMPEDAFERAYVTYPVGTWETEQVKAIESTMTDSTGFLNQDFADWELERLEVGRIVEHRVLRKRRQKLNDRDKSVAFQYRMVHRHAPE